MFGKFHFCYYFLQTKSFNLLDRERLHLYFRLSFKFCKEEEDKEMIEKTQLQPNTFSQGKSEITPQTILFS